MAVALVKMYTLEKLKNALSTLEADMKSIPSVISIKVGASSPVYAYYTDGEAAGCIAVISLQIKLPNPKPFEAKIAYDNMYLFPDGKLLTHFMSDAVEWEVTKSCIDVVEKWLATIA